MANPLVVTNLVKSFNGRKALDGVSLEVREGEVLGLLGPNGAGKSTLVRTIMGRVTPNAGEVVIFGTPARAGDNAARETAANCSDGDRATPIFALRCFLLAIVGAPSMTRTDALEVAIVT